MAHTVAFAEGTFNPVTRWAIRIASSSSPRKSSTPSSGTAWKKRWRAGRYDIVPDYDKLLEIMTSAKREASGG